ncbi:MAG: class I SAM-dependent methyltransferase, partial [Planctomycetota bacterium]
PALELAVGTGRVAIPIARAGVPVVGLDITPEMLAVLAKKVEAEPDLPLEWVEGDMRDVDLTERGPFGLVYCPARAFLHHLTVEDQLACLANVRRHLPEGGVFAGNIFFPRVDLIHKRQNRVQAWEWSHEYEDPDTGERVLVTELARIDTRRQRIDVVNRCESLDERGIVTRTEMRDLVLTYLWPRELEHLLHRAGFTIEHLYGDFERTPFEEGGEELVWVARKR